MPVLNVYCQIFSCQILNEIKEFQVFTGLLVSLSIPFAELDQSNERRSR